MAHSMNREHFGVRESAAKADCMLSKIVMSKIANRIHSLHGWQFRSGEVAPYVKTKEEFKITYVIIMCQ